ncbi:MAG: hypothetical protein ACLU3I_01165 [Acutalibacteraceae bacterium]
MSWNDYPALSERCYYLKRCQNGLRLRVAAEAGLCGEIRVSGREFWLMMT